MMELEQVIAELDQPLDKGLISSDPRVGHGKPYLTNQTAIAQANRIFGYDGWSHQICGDVKYVPISEMDTRTGETRQRGIYYARVQVAITPLGVYHEDVGCQPLAADTPEGHDTAIKGSVSDGIKRALRHLGNQFGLEFEDGGAIAARPTSTRHPVQTQSQNGGHEQSLDSPTNTQNSPWCERHNCYYGWEMNPKTGRGGWAHRDITTHSWCIWSVPQAPQIDSQNEGKSGESIAIRALPFNPEE